MDNDFATGYALGSDSGNGNNSGFGGWGDGLWAIIILAMIWGGNGWGGFGGGSNSPGFQGYATRADVNEAIAFNGVERGISNIQQGICDSTYALNNAITSGFNNTNVAMLQGFSGVDKSMCQLGYNLQDCCCQTQRAIDGVNYNMAKNTCDIIQAQNASTQRIIDYLTQNEITSLRTELTQAQAQLSQFNQTNNIVNALKMPTPVPAYITCSPYQAAFGNFGGGCCA